MKNLLVVVLLIFASGSIYSQDLIVTNEGDSINCKITKIKSEYIYFTFKYKEEIRSTLLLKSGIKYHQLGYYKFGEVPSDKIIGFVDYQHFRFAVNGGYSYRIAKVSESVPAVFKDYVKKLKSGYNIGGDFTYYFSETMGLGVKYYLSKSSNSIDNIYIEDVFGNRTYGKMSDDITISFIGPSFSTSIMSKDKSNITIMSMAMGYMGYVDNKVMIDKYKMTGNTLGLELDFGYDMGISDNLAIGFQVSFFTGILTQMTWDNGLTKEKVDLERGELENISRLDFSVGLRFRK